MSQTIKSLKDLQSIPVGANKQFLVSMGSVPYAGFNTRKEAETYIEMQKSKRKIDKKEAMAALQTWSITEKP